MILLEDDLTLKVTCPARKSTCPGLPDGTFFRALNPTRLGCFYNVCAEFYRHIVGQLNERFTRGNFKE